MIKLGKVSEQTGDIKQIPPADPNGFPEGLVI